MRFRRRVRQNVYGVNHHPRKCAVSTFDRRSYHHGDLRDALLRSALRLLDADGVDALSLRAVARDAGVSANAPYRHYRDKEALLAALASHGFTELTACLEAASSAGTERGDAGSVRAASPPAALADAVAPMARATVHYALEHPGLFRLMFGHVCVSLPEVIAASDAAQAVVTRRIAGFAAPGYRDTLKIGVWALVHGLTSLLLDGRLGEPTRETADALVDSAVRTMIGADWAPVAADAGGDT
ncbi:TetR/AcrR family transcriptional regulator [Streptomyces corynorhini]|uniref:TetR/AcrR family transcriptional regulator n=1 Tax=Streptomyces corynorhini TaxID=2282652 RepID=A0A370B9M3_9ACTN|nr:TetR/AcrR family transcriptional regulator [Streptomyces corynorhini]